MSEQKLTWYSGSVSVHDSGLPALPKTQFTPRKLKSVCVLFLGFPFKVYSLGLSFFFFFSGKKSLGSAEKNRVGRVTVTTQLVFFGLIMLPNVDTVYDLVWHMFKWHSVL